VRGKFQGLSIRRLLLREAIRPAKRLTELVIGRCCQWIQLQ
jgi:hypothetical protein